MGKLFCQENHSHILKRIYQRRQILLNKASFSRHPLITGALILTIAGLLSRIIGFFYRIFLSRIIGAEGLGIYQLISPVFSLTFALTVAGFQTAISKFVAEAGASSDQSSSCRPKPSTYLYAGLSISLLLSLLSSFFLYRYADILAIHVLSESRCAPLLRILAFTIPFGAVHSCINGYFYGLQKTAVPAISQLLEQIARVGSVYLICQITISQGKNITAEVAVWGIVIGEVIAVLYCISVSRFQKSGNHFSLALKHLSSMALPLTINRVLLNVFHSVETIMIPVQLRAFGYSSGEALSVYGVLTGMAMPMVLFPSVITNSVSVMLLPAISEAQASKDIGYIKKAVKKSCFYCIFLGLGCTIIFLITGRWLGSAVFSNSMAGSFMMVLGWLCPFLYLTTTLGSILNGLGKTTSTFLLNLISSGIRIFFVYFLIPVFGIKAYLWGMLVSQLADSGISILILRKVIWK